MAYLGNKKIILILAGLLIIGAGFWIFKKNQSDSPVATFNVATGPIIAEEIDKDSDNDGLKDWEETLWKTDPNDADTDKDGTLDGQEIRENRNPLLAGKNDKLEAAKIDAKNLAILESPPTLTSALAQEFASLYLTAKQKKGGELTQEEQKALLDYLTGVVEKFGEFQEAENKNSQYTKSDIKIAGQENENTIKEYGNNLALIIKKYFDSIPETEMIIFQRALDNEDESELKKLKPIALAYRNTAKEALSLEVPETFSESHLAIINSFNEIARAIEGLEKAISDPAQSLWALKEYREKAVIAYLFLRNLYAYFLHNKIAFEDNEPAKLFEVYWQAI